MCVVILLIDKRYVCVVCISPYKKNSCTLISIHNPSTMPCPAHLFSMLLFVFLLLSSNFSSFLEMYILLIELLVDSL